MIRFHNIFSHFQVVKIQRLKVGKNHKHSKPFPFKSPAKSFDNQNSMCKFSILRIFSGIPIISRNLVLGLKYIGRFQVFGIHTRSRKNKYLLFVFYKYL